MAHGYCCKGCSDRDEKIADRRHRRRLGKEDAKQRLAEAFDEDSQWPNRKGQVRGVGKPPTRTDLERARRKAMGKWVEIGSHWRMAPGGEWQHFFSVDGVWLAAYGFLGPHHRWEESE